MRLGLSIVEGVDDDDGDKAVFSVALMQQQLRWTLRAYRIFPQREKRQKIELRAGVRGKIID